MPDIQPTCPKCGDALVAEKPYCPNCGLAVGSPANRASIDPYLQAKIDQELSLRLKDQSSLVREIGDKAEDVVWSRLKRYGWVVTAIIVVLGLWGLKSIDDAGKKIVEDARERVEPLIKSAENRAQSAQVEINKTADKVTALDKLVDAKTQSLSDLQLKIVAAENDLKAYDQRMHDYESRVTKSGSDALAQVDSLKANSQTELDEIAKLRDRLNVQQKELTETGSLVKDLAARTKIEGFKTGQDNFAVITHDTSKQSVYMKLDRKPYPQTVRLQWNTATQPLDSYIVVGNLVLLNWADTIDKFSQRSIYVSYVVDASTPTQELYRTLSVKDKRAYIDGKPLPYIGVPDATPAWILSQQ